MTKALFRKALSSGPIGVKVCGHCHARTEKCDMDCKLRCAWCTAKLITGGTDEGIEAVAGASSTAR